MEGWVDLSGWLHSKTVWLSTESPIHKLTGADVKQLR